MTTKRSILSILIVAALTLSPSFALRASASFCFIPNGCTGTSTAPTFGQLLIGGRNGEYEFIASSTFASVYPFPGGGNSTSTLTQFFAGLTAFASSTMGNGSQAGGLTISGGATTTGAAYFAGPVGIGAITPGSFAELKANLYPASNFGNRANYQLLLRNITNNNGDTVGLAFASDSSDVNNVGAAIVHNRSGSNDQGGLQFLTKQSTSQGAAPAVAAVLNQLGFFGVGTSTPWGQLLVQTFPALGTAPMFVIGSSTKSAFIVDNGSNVLVPGTGTVQLGIGNVATTSASALTLSQTAAASGISLYNTANQDTNYERLSERWAGNQAQLFVENGGGGSGHQFLLQTDNNSSNRFASLLLDAQSNPKVIVGFTGGSSTGATDVLLGTNVTFGATSGSPTVVSLTPTLTQSSFAGYTALKIQPTETSLGTGTNLFVQAGTSTAPDLFDVTNKGWLGIGTSTPYSRLHVTAGANATTTVNFGEVGISTSKACFNTKNTAGADISFYFVGTAMVVESNLCR